MKCLGGTTTAFFFTENAPAELSEPWKCFAETAMPIRCICSAEGDDFSS